MAGFGLAWLAVVTILGVWLQGQTISPAEQSSTPTVTASPAAKIIPPPAGYRFPDGQTYIYSVEWRMFTAGKAQLTMAPAGLNQRVSAMADSAGLVDVLYEIHDRFEAFFDPRTFCSLHISKHSEEGSRKRQTDIDFDYAIAMATDFGQNAITVVSIGRPAVLLFTPLMA